MKRSKDGDKLCGGVDAQPALLEVFLAARDDAVCVRGRCSRVEHSILEVREIELEGLDQNRENRSSVNQAYLEVWMLRENVLP